MDTRTSYAISALSVVLLVAGVGQADEPAWISGTCGPAAWTISPAQPRDNDVIHFSGPVSAYLNECLAEAAFGGRPTIRVDATAKTVELRFTPPAATGCGDVVEPVCGIQGAFGPLASGQWRFFCTKTGVVFSLTFQVAGQGSKVSIYYVDAAIKQPGDGSSWALAFEYLQDALVVATSGNEIHVAGGVYRPDLGGDSVEWDPAATFRPLSGVTLLGGYAGSKQANPNERDTALYETILTGDLYGNDNVVRSSDLVDPDRRADNSHHVVTISDTDAAVVVDGFTITGGGNFGSDLQDEQGYGAGIYNCNGHATLRNCRIVNNSAQACGGGLYNGNGGYLTVVSCTFTGNRSGSWGGAIYDQSNSDVSIDRCLVNGNLAAAGAGITTRGFGDLTLSNSLISGNSAGDGLSGCGGGLYCLQTALQMNHCTLAGNRAATAPALMCDTMGSTLAGSISLRNCIVWNDSSAIVSVGTRSVQVTYSDVQGGYPGKGNLTVDPRFIKPGSWDLNGTPDDWSDDAWTDGNYRLAGNSPCIDKGDPLEVPSAGTLDLAGQPRLSGAAVDMGAYEWKNDTPVARTESLVTGFSPDGKTGVVTLDGTASYDPEHSVLTFRWYENGVLVSKEPVFTIELPLGEYTFTLIVNDGMTDSLPAKVTVRITAFLSTTLDFVPNQISRSGRNDPITAVLSLPSGKQPADFNQSQLLLLTPGYVPAVTQVAQIWLNGTPMVIATFDKAAVLKAMPTNGTFSVQVFGQLKNGSYFSGTQKLTISK
jgi:hypothetical protein